MKNISVVINYCSNEEPFLEACLTECSKFSPEIVVSYGSHLYSGQIEDVKHISEMKKKFPFINFVEYPVDVTINLQQQRGVINRPHAYWHNLARWFGVQNISLKNWVLFLDVDEIPDGYSIKKWFQSHELDEFDSFKLANYWYFKKPNFQAKTWEDTPVLIHGRHISEATIFGDAERDHIIKVPSLRLFRYVLGNNFRPMIHHYSWVRTPSQMLFKLKNWGHQTDFNNHEQMVAHVFRDDSVNDIVHNYSYIEIPDKFNIKI